MRGAAEAKKLERGAIRAMISSLLAAFFFNFFLSLYFIGPTIRTGDAVQHEVLRLCIYKCMYASVRRLEKQLLLEIYLTNLFCILVSLKRQM